MASCYRGQAIWIGNRAKSATEDALAVGLVRIRRARGRASHTSNLPMLSCWCLIAKQPSIYRRRSRLRQLSEAFERYGSRQDKSCEVAVAGRLTPSQAIARRGIRTRRADVTDYRRCCRTSTAVPEVNAVWRPNAVVHQVTSMESESRKAIFSCPFAPSSDIQLRVVVFLFSRAPNTLNCTSGDMGLSGIR